MLRVRENRQPDSIFPGGIERLEVTMFAALIDHLHLDAVAGEVPEAMSAISVAEGSRVAEPPVTDVI